METDVIKKKEEKEYKKSIGKRKENKNERKSKKIYKFHTNLRTIRVTELVLLLRIRFNFRFATLHISSAFPRNLP